MDIQLSIIICCHNEEQALPRCIKSLALHEHPQWEAICVDDASTDKTPQILDFFSKKYSNLKIINFDINIGLGAARNYGLFTARGKYLCFLDGDDYIDAAALATNVEILNNGNADIVMTPHKHVSDGRTTEISIPQGIFEGHIGFSIYLSRQFGSWSACFAVYLRKTLLQNMCLFSSGFLYEDVIFCMKAIYNSNQVITSSIAHYTYDIRTVSITRQKKWTFFHTLSSARLYSDICETILKLPKSEMNNLAFARACEILSQDHFPRMELVLMEEFRLRSSCEQTEFLYYLRYSETGFARSVFNLLKTTGYLT